MRLDIYLVKKGFFRSRDRAQEAIRNGQVLVEGKIKTRPSFDLTGEKVEVLVEDFGYVSRAALKLESALQKFKIEVKGKVCLDIGVATGGFTDLLLQKGAQKIYEVDVGEGQLASELVNQQKIIFRNFTDARNLQKTDFEEKLDLIVIDVSFISITLLIPALLRITDRESEIIALIKPQFEVGARHDGVIIDQKILNKILTKVRQAFLDADFEIQQEMPSAVKGKEGNQEFLWLIKRSS
ncbi:TlyA family RNA methyltransferase [Candidatus Peregrinibacteria bacterium]|nr:TlyA family RNA methyltransferase [Candidatus Peregrinibacteria bacterium]